MKTARFYLWLMALVLVSPARGYNVTDIPGPLKENADAVIRLDRKEFTFLSAGSATLTVKYVVTVLNEKGEEEAEMAIQYDKEIKIASLEGVIYSESGAVTKRLTIKDFVDRALITGLADYSDSRVKVYGVGATKYPFTIEYSYRLNFTGLIGFPSWVPVTEPNVSLERSEYVVHAPVDFPLRYKAYNYSQEPSRSEEKGITTWSWSMDNVRTAKTEPFSPPFREVAPLVLIAPDDFMYGKVSGSMANWEEFGNWSKGLIADRDDLPAEAITEVKALVENISDPKEKARKVYEYMQHRTRYVSIQFGIGGFQPFPASETHELGYGDCKALTMYTHALMKAVGVESYYTLIYAGSNGRNKTDPSFPSSAFNHVFLCMPFGSDTVFTECTSQQVPFGHMGDFTCDRYALMITENGGKLIHTPGYSETDNQACSWTQVEVAADGNATADLRMKFTGLKYDDRLSVWLRSPDEQRKAMIKALGIGKFDLGAISYEEDRGIPASLSEKVAVTLPRYAALTGTRMFLPLNLENKLSSSLPSVADRKTEVYFEDGFTLIDTVTYHLPAGYKVEAKPESVNLESRFGTYEAGVTIDGETAIYTRKRIVHAGHFPADTYPELVGFYDSMIKADKMSLVLVKI